MFDTGQPLHVIDYDKIKTLSQEARERLNKNRPISIGNAAELPGVSKADLMALLVWLHRPHPRGATMHQTCLDSLFSGSLRRRRVSLLALERLKRLGSAGQAIHYLAKHT